MSMVKNKVPKISNSFDKFSTKRVSYILITKNRDRLLEKTLNKAKNWVTKNDELIIVDGGSTDKTISVIKKYSKLVDKFISEKDSMPSHAGNKGILISHGKYIKMLTDDDIIYPNAMAKAIEVMERSPEIDILECGGTRYRKATKKWETIYRPPGSNYPKDIDDAFKVGINVMGLVIRRSSLSKIGLFPLNLLTDSLFLVNALKNGAIVKFARIKLYHQTIYRFSINQARRDDLEQLFFKAVKEHASRGYYYRFAFNWFVQNNPYMKVLILPLIVPLRIYRNIQNNFSKEKKSEKIRRNTWDEGFS